MRPARWWRRDSSTCTCTCASPGRRTWRRWRRGRWPPRPAGSPAVCAMPNTDPVTRQPGGGRLRGAPGAAGRQGAGVSRSARCRWARGASNWPSSANWSGAGAVAVSDDGKPVASSHLMRTALEYAQDLRDPGGRSLRGPDARGRRRRCTRGSSRTRLGLKGIPGRGRGDHGGPGHPPGRAHRGSRPPLPHVHPRLGRPDPPGEGHGAPGHRGGRPAPLRADPRARARGTTPTRR